MLGGNTDCATSASRTLSFEGRLSTKISAKKETRSANPKRIRNGRFIAIP
jgi:hypothetical protein